ncbi:Malonyl CoA-acyl carrier protein transacylase [Serratia symbiotica]|nr:Malonyl CoA-acyl carrier protein transacylase [Serratia symbiotica]
MTKFAFIFPGQGAQSLGMLTELASKFSIVEKIFSEASDVLGYDLWKLVQKGPVEILNKTWHTQPALLTASVAIFHIWKKESKKIPMLMAGHSLGEYSALVCSGVLDFQSAIYLVELRGKLMQEAVPEGIGTMCAIIGLDKKTIMQACNKSAHGQIVSLVNFNSPNQIVIAGHKEAVKRASIICKSSGAKHVIPLLVSVPSHCKLMIPAARKLSIALNSISFKTPNIPVINNVDVRIEHDPKMICKALVRQLYNPVRWSESIEYILSHGIRLLLEISPKKVLSKLNKYTINSLSINTINNFDSLLEAIKKCN